VPGSLILIIEDDPPTAEAIHEKLSASGYHPLVAHTGEDGLRSFYDHEPDLVILDLMLPDADGADICRAIRRTATTPIVMLTAKVEEVDRIVGLEIGADDYIPKPFSTKELVARVRAVLRRSERSMSPPSVIRSAAGIVVDEGRREVSVEGDVVHLTPTQYNILSLLMKHAGEAVSRDVLVAALWGHDDLSANLLEIHIGHLRRKIELNHRRPQRLLTVRSFGYRIAGDDYQKTAGATETEEFDEGPEA
jgi:DNA-binding response OmpR family regulator